MKNLLSELKNKILFCDGAMGTELVKYGFKSGDCPEEWNITNKDKIKSIHKSYVDAGCDIILTNTFGANRINLKKFNLEDKVHHFNLAGADLAREVAGDNHFVFGDIGSTGELLEPYGNLTIQELEGAFREQINALLHGKVDAIIFETMSSIEEITTGIKISKKISDLPVIASMTFERGTHGYKTMMGVNIETAVKKLIESNADIIGTNCGKGIDETIEIIKEMRKTTEIFLIAEPNAGIPKIVDGKVVYNETPDIMGKKTSLLVKAGINIIGGCCGTTPSHIKEIIKYGTDCKLR